MVIGSRVTVGMSTAVSHAASREASQYVRLLSLGKWREILPFGAVAELTRVQKPACSQAPPGNALRPRLRLGCAKIASSGKNALGKLLCFCSALVALATTGLVPVER